MIDIDAHEGRRRLVLRHTAHGAADPGLLRKAVQRRHNDGGNNHRDDGGVADGDAADGDGFGEKRVRDLGVRPNGRDGLGQIFQHKTHGDGGNQAGQTVPGFSHGPVGQQLHQHSHTGADDNGGNHRQPAGEAQAQHDGDAEKQGVAAHHDEVAVSEVDELDNAVDHGIAQGDQGVDTAQPQAGD